MLNTMLKDRELFLFLFLIVAVNTAFVSAIHAKVLPGAFYNEGRFLLLGGVLLAVVFAFRRREGLIELFRPMMAWRVSPLWFVLTLLLPPATCVVTLLIKGIGNSDLFSAIHVDFETVFRPRVLMTVALGAFIGEIVWVSYAMGRLQKTTGVPLASLIVGVFWTLWWVPIVIINVGVIPNLPLDALFINMVGVAAMCGFIYSHTKSGLAVLTLQLSLNTSLLIFPVTPTAESAATYWLFSIIYFVVVLMFYTKFGPQFCPPDRQATESISC